MRIKCPVCAEELIKNNNVYQCAKHHSFDISKEGYCNLLRKQAKKEYGDSVLQVKARRAFFSRDYYAPLKKETAALIRSLHKKTLVDSGCGEGYYTGYFQKELPEMEVIGCDISKKAVSLAARNSGAGYFVASNQELPFFDHSVDIVLNMFAPIAEKEYLRILKDDGVLITVQVGVNHLLQLKEALYDTVYLNELNDLTEQFTLKESHTVSFDIDLKNNEEISDLFMMTPYYYHSSRKARENLEKLSSLSTLCEFEIRLYHKNI